MKRAVLAALILAVALGEPSAAQWRPGGVMRIVLLVDSSTARFAVSWAASSSRISAFCGRRPIAGRSS